jgi:hypothetical protein
MPGPGNQQKPNRRGPGPAPFFSIPGQLEIRAGAGPYPASCAPSRQFGGLRAGQQRDRQRGFQGRRHLEANRPQPEGEWKPTWHGNTGTKIDRRPVRDSAVSPANYGPMDLAAPHQPAVAAWSGDMPDRDPPAAQPVRPRPAAFGTPEAAALWRQCQRASGRARDRQARRGRAGGLRKARGGTASAGPAKMAQGLAGRLRPLRLSANFSLSAA